MTESTETAQTQNAIQPVASTSNCSLIATENRTNSLALPNEQGNKAAQEKIVNTVTNSPGSQINSTSNTIYNASVVINNIYQQHDNAKQLAMENTRDVPENLIFKSFSSIRRRGKVQRKSSIKWYIIVPVLLLLIIGLIVALMIRPSDSENSQTVYPISLSNTTPDPGDLRIVPRIEWGARSPRAKAVVLTIRPAPLVIIHHTVTMLCYFLDQCITSVRNIQNFHMDRYDVDVPPWDDIGYNFLVGGDGFVYEGRGWNVAGAHTKFHNQESVGISLIGTFFKEDPTTVQLRATRRLIEYGVKNRYISVDYKLLAHRQCRNSTDPGDALYSIIKTWDHWSPKCPVS